MPTNQSFVLVHRPGRQLGALDQHFSAHHLHLDTVSQFEIEFLMSNQRIVLVQLVEFSLLEEQDCIEVILFDLPKLFFKGREGCPSAFGNHDCPLVVIHMIWSISIFIPNILGFQEIETLLILPLCFFRQDPLSFGCSEEEVVGS